MVRSQMVRARRPRAVLHAAIVAGFAILIKSPVAHAMPAAPVVITEQQPDGTTFKMRLRGDERFHWHETAAGNPIIKDPKSGFWVYAVPAASGLAAGTARVGQQAAPQAWQPQAPASAQALRQSQTTVGAADVPSTGTGYVPTILVSFPDRTPTYGTADFQNLIQGTGNHSMKELYTEMSGGTFTVSTGPGGVVGWYVASHPHDYYGQNVSGSGSDAHAGELVREAVVAADAAGFDFSPYDLDHDGQVDVINVVHQGTGEEFTGHPSTDIWSHRWDLNSSGAGEVDTDDGTIVNDYTIEPELLDGTTMQTVGVFCHEYGHAMGLPDLYDTDGSSEGLGNWSLMAGGGWNRSTGASGSSPAHMDPWCKIKFGWITPQVPTTNTLNASIPATETTRFAYKLWTNGSQGSEYFLVENRQKTGFDAGLPGSGLLIYHVDEAMDSWPLGNDDNTREWYPGHTSSGHYMIAVEQADNFYDLETAYNRGDSGDPYASPSSFAAGTSPSSNAYNGSGTLVGVTNISASGSTMTADIAVAPSSGGPLSVSITDPVHNQTYSSISQATGSAGGTGLSQVKVGLAIYNSGGTARTGWWNWGTSTFSTDPNTMLTTTATGTSSWSIALPSASMPARKYDFVAFSSDGTNSSSTVTHTFTVTGVVPYSITITTPAASSSSSAVRTANGTAAGTGLDSVLVGLAHYNAGGTTRLGWWNSSLSNWDDSNTSSVWVYWASGTSNWTFDVASLIPSTMMTPGRYDIVAYTYDGSNFHTSALNTFYIVAAGAPTATAGSTTEDSTTGATVTLSANAADGANVTHFKISGITGGTLYQSNGTTTISNGSFITAAQGGAGLKFKPSANLNSPAGDTIRFTAQAAVDSSGTCLGTGTNAVPTVSEVNDLPVATADTLASMPGNSGAHNIPFSDLVGNDSAGPSNEVAQALTVSQVANAVGGTASISGSNVVFTPTIGYTGSAGFDYTLQDNGTTNGAADAKTATGHASFTITTAANTPPTATAQAVSLVQGGTKVITLTGSDIDNNPLRFKIATLPAQGSLYDGSGTAGHKIVAGDLPYLLAAANVTYRPTLTTFVGSDSFTFNANDGTADSSSAATVSLTVAADTTVPTVVLSNPPDGANSSNRTSFFSMNGTAGDDGAIVSVKLSLFSYTLSKYWTGSAWAASGSLNATYYSTAGTWTYTGALPNDLNGATNLPEGKYRVIATAKDAGNNASTATSIVTINMVVPAVAITAPANNGTVANATAFPTISGTAADATGLVPSGLQRVSLLLFSYPRNAYWNGSAWQAASFRLNAALDTGTGAWSYSGPLPSSADGNLNEGKYKITATAYDNAGNNNSANNTASVNMVAPAVTIAAPTNEATLNGISTFPAVNGTTGDANGIQPSGINRVTLSVYSYQRNAYWTGSAWGSQTMFPTTLDTGTGQWSYTGSSLPGGGNLREGKYRILAWAYDNVNNASYASCNIYVNMVAPTVAIASPVNNSTVSGVTVFPTISGTAADSAGAVPSGLNKVTLLLYSYPRNAYWNGTAWQAGSFRLTAVLNTGTGAWSLSSGLPDNAGSTLDDAKYKVTATSYDMAGNTASATSVVTVHPATGAMPPTGVALSSAAVSLARSAVSLTFAAGLDAASAVDLTHYVVTVNGAGVVPVAARYSSGTVALDLPAGSLHQADVVVVVWSGLADQAGRPSSGQTPPLTVK